jgi:sugar-phosphatase
MPIFEGLEAASLLLRRPAVAKSGLSAQRNRFSYDHEMDPFSVVGDFSAALFDMDGTLVDSTALVESEWAEWARRRGLDPFKVAHFSHGRRTEDAILQYIPNADVANELVEFREMAAKLDQSTVRPIAGAVDFVQSMSETKWAVVTSAPASVARRRLSACGFPSPTVLVSAEDVFSGKPDPEGFLRASQELEEVPRDCIVFEDAPAGATAALAAHMRVVVLRTTHPEHIFPECIQVNDFTDLIAKTLPSGGFRLALSR